MKSLIALPFVSRKEYADAFLEYLIWLKVEPTRTHFRDIRKLAPSHYLTVDLATGESSEPVRFWQYVRQPRRNVTMDEACEELHSLLTESLELHLRADVPTGLLLSGGLDSRTVAFYSQKVLNDGLRTYSIGFGAEDSELADAKRTAEEIRSAEHVAITLGPDDLRNDLQQVAWHLDEPVGDGACFAVRRICQRAKEDVTVLLGGEGADEIFTGYASAYVWTLQTLQKSDWLRRLTLGLVPSPKSLPGSRWKNYLYRAGMSRAEELVQIRQLGLPGDIRHPRGFTEAQLREVPRLNRKLSDIPDLTLNDPFLELTMFDTDWHLAESLLQKSDKMSMSASVELRCPFLDPRLAEFAFSLPREMKLTSDGIGKYVLRKTLQKHFHEPLDRPKKGFPLPLDDWFRGPLRDYAEETLFASNSHCLEKLDRRLIEEMWDDFVNRGWPGGLIIYSLLLYEEWRRSAIFS